MQTKYSLFTRTAHHDALRVLYLHFTAHKEKKRSVQMTKNKKKPAPYLSRAFLACIHTQGTEEFPDNAEQLMFFKLKSFQVRQYIPSVI